MSSSEHERRNAPRYPARAYASVHTVDNKWSAHLLDISATGARLAILDEHSLKTGNAISLHLELDELISDLQTENLLILKGKVVHARDHIVGMLLEETNIEQQTQLDLLLKQFSQR